MTESLSEVKKMSGLGARGNYLLIKLETAIPNPQSEVMKMQEIHKPGYRAVIYI